MQKLKLAQGVLLALIYLPLDLLVTAIGWLLAPVLPLFARDDGWLPRWLWWFQTPDNTIDGDHAFNTPSKHPYLTSSSSFTARRMSTKNPAWQVPEIPHRLEPGSKFNEQVLPRQSHQVLFYLQPVQVILKLQP